MQLTPTVRRNIEDLISWLVNEIGGNYWLADEHWNPDRKSYYNQPKGVHQFDYRVSCHLVSEHYRLLTLFAHQLFKHYLTLGNNKFSDPIAACNSIIPLANTMAERSVEVMTIGHEKSAEACCLLFNEEFPTFSKLLSADTLDTALWCFCDQNDAIHSSSNGMRKIFIAEAEIPTTEYAYKHDRASQKKLYRWHVDGDNIHWTKTTYAIAEEWRTDTSYGDTFGWNYYSFNSFKDAKIFMMRLLTKLNTPEQNQLLQKLEHVATNITKKFKATVNKLFNPKKSPQKKLKASTNSKLPTARKHVYAFDMGNGTVKIGISQDIENRRSTVMGHSGLFIKRYAYTELMPKHDAKGAEKNLHRIFFEHKTNGEFFKIPYEDVLKAMAAYGELTHKQSLI